MSTRAGFHTIKQIGFAFEMEATVCSRRQLWGRPYFRIALLVLLGLPASAEASSGTRRYEDRELLVEVIGTVYGNWPCDDGCRESLRRRLHATRDPVAALCGDALVGRAVPPMRLDDVSWLSTLASHWPVWRLFWEQRTAPQPRRPLSSELAGTWLTIYERHLLPRMRSAVQKDGWRRNPTAPFRSFIKQFRELADDVMIAEWYLSVAGALRLGKTMHSISLPEDPPLELVHNASDWFLSKGQRVVSNRTDGIPERLLQMLAYNEAVRIGGFDLWPDVIPPTGNGVFAGANDGIVLRVASETLPRARVFAFEADPFVYEKLKTNLKLWNRDRQLLVPTLAALHREHGLKIEIQTRDGIGAQSTIFATTDTFKETWPWVEFGTSVKVDAVALEPFLRGRGVDRLDFVFLDVECAELLALQGARSLLSNTTLLHLEVSNAELCQGGPLWPDFERWLNRRGFRTIILPEKPWEIRMDITAVRWPLPKWPEES